MKITTIIGTVIAAVGLAACGSTVAPTISPAVALSVVPTATATPIATPIPTPSPSEGPSPSASASPSPSVSPSASPSPTEGPCGYQPCGTGAGWTTTCGSPGTAHGGSLIITWTAGYGQTDPVVPDYITVDGNVVDVTSNPFTSGPYTVGNHSFTTPTDEGPSANGSFPFTVIACGVVTVTTTCSQPNIALDGTGSATFSGLTVDAGINVGQSTYPTAITSSTLTVKGLSVSSEGWIESNDYGLGVITLATGTVVIAACRA
jgi:hypothetical protein